ncbi:MAG: hypothetical protein R2881_01480 [Eubacteriales bacterium]
MYTNIVSANATVNTSVIGNAHQTAVTSEMLERIQSGRNEYEQLTRQKIHAMEPFSVDGLEHHGTIDADGGEHKARRNDCQRGAADAQHLGRRVEEPQKI